MKGPKQFFEAGTANQLLANKLSEFLQFISHDVHLMHVLLRWFLYEFQKLITLED